MNNENPNNNIETKKEEIVNKIDKPAEQIILCISIILLILSISPVLLVIIEVFLERYFGLPNNTIPDVVFDTLMHFSPTIFFINTILLTVGKIRLPKSTKISAVFFINLYIIVSVIAILLYIQATCSSIRTCN